MTIDEELAKLEDSIRRVKIEYEAYFNGGAPRPPRDTVFRVETAIKKFSSEMGELNFGQRFRFNQLAQKYAVYNDLWRKKLKDIEEGRAATGLQRLGVEARPAEHPFEVVCSEPAAQPQKLEELLQALVQAKRRVGEPVDRIDPAVFARFVREKTDEVKRRLHCDRVQFSVSVQDGKVKLKAGKAIEG